MRCPHEDDQLQRVEKVRNERTQSFRAVPERSFNSILRRSLVIILKGRFLSADMLSRLRLPPGVRNHEPYGYFLTEADLPSFVQSKPAGAALLPVLAVANNKQECERIIEAYAEGGGNLGITVGTMRKSCNLPPVSAPSRPAAREGTVDSARPPDVPGAADQSTRGGCGNSGSRRIPSSIETEADSLMPFHVSLIFHCLDHQKDLLSDKRGCQGDRERLAWHGCETSRRHLGKDAIVRLLDKAAPQGPDRDPLHASHEARHRPAFRSQGT